MSLPVTAAHHTITETPGTHRHHHDRSLAGDLLRLGTESVGLYKATRDLVHHIAALDARLSRARELHRLQQTHNLTETETQHLADALEDADQAASDRRTRRTQTRERQRADRADPQERHKPILCCP